MKKLNIFILEDNEQRIQLFKSNYKAHNLTIYKTAKNAIKSLKSNLDYDLFLLDHDLGNEIDLYLVVNNYQDEDNCGSRVAEFLSDKDVKGKVIIHSWNWVGANRMLKILPKARWIPFQVNGFGVKVEGVIL